MKGVTKTLVLYGALGLVTALTVVVVALGTEDIKTALIYILPLILLISIAALFIDAIGALCVILAILPFSFGIGQIEIGVITLNPYFLGIMATTFFVLIKTIIFSGKYGFTKVDLAIAVLCFTYLVSTLYSDSFLESGFLAFRGIFIPVLSYYSLKGMVLTDSQSRQATGFFVGGITIFSVLAIEEFLKLHARVELLGVAYIGVATFTISAVYYLYFLKWWKSLLGAIALLLCFGVFVLALSRVYLLVMLVSPFIFWVIRRGKAFRLLTVMMPITLIGTLLITAFPEFVRPVHYDPSVETKIERVTSLDFWKGSLYGRALSYQVSLNEFAENPVFGTGLKKGRYTITTHDFHLEWLEYGGTIGYLLFTSIFFLHFWSAGKLATGDTLVAVNLLIIFTILLNGLTNGFMHGIMPYVAWISLGMNEARIRFINLQAAKHRTNMKSHPGRPLRLLS